MAPKFKLFDPSRLNLEQQRDFAALTRNTGGNFTNLGGEEGLMKRYGQRSPLPIAGGGISIGGPTNLPPMLMSDPISPTGPFNKPPMPMAGPISPTGPLNKPPMSGPISPIGPTNKPPINPISPTGPFNKPPIKRKVPSVGSPSSRMMNKMGVR